MRRVVEVLLDIGRMVGGVAGFTGWATTLAEVRLQQ
jgi:hypothetical protein